MTTNLNYPIDTYVPVPDGGVNQASGARRFPENHVDVDQQLLPEELFLQRVCLERKRAERSGMNFALFLLHVENNLASSNRDQILAGMVNIVNAARRKTDLAGWYIEGSILGIIFHDLGTSNDSAAINKFRNKIHEKIDAQWSDENLQQVDASMHFFSEHSTTQGATTTADPVFYPDLFRPQRPKRASLFLKRIMDIIGSSVALMLLAPLLVVIAAIIRMTSKGPVFFKQERLGHFGKSFTCLKFRSMRADNDPKIHQEFMKRLISGAHNAGADGSKPVFKMKDDPRVTKIGRVLRRLSLDELPQFINVFKGDMSLVGPRPPLAYEFNEYDVWHRRRVLEARPGLTGLWQVKGRSRVSFDDMVRLDLHYVRHWSLWLDIQILIQTPRAVLSGDGAY